jgi:AraC-like DNA-binding protein
VEEARELGINLIARSFITAHISLAPLGNKTGAGGDGIRGETKAEMIIKSIAANYPGVILFRSGKLGFGVIIADSTSVGLEESAYSFVQAVKYEVERTIAFRLVAEVGPEAARLGEIPESYAKAEKAARFDDTRPDARYSAVIMKAKGYIDAHFAEQDTSLHSVASNVGISPNHLSTVFAQETGERFIDYLTRCRIEKAKELLKGTAKRSLDIAEETGFSDPHYFSFIFKKATGLTPREYRLS